MQENVIVSPALSRRQFIRTSSMVAATAAAAMSFPSVLRAQNKQPINAVIIGIGGRGGGAGGDFLEACKATGAEGKIVAVADIFPEQARRGKDNFGVPGRQVLQRFRLLYEGASGPGRELRHPGLASRFPRRSFQGLCRGRQTRLHGKAGGRGRPHLPDHVCGRGGIQKEGLESRRRHAAASPGWLCGNHQTPQRRRHRRCHLPPRLLGQRRPDLASRRPWRYRPGEADPQLVPLHLAVRRSYLRTARP